MRWKQWVGLVGVVLICGIVGLRLRGAPVPAPRAEPAPQAGRFVWTKLRLLRLQAGGEKVGEEVHTLLDTATGRVWVLEANAGKGPRHKWVLEAEAPP